MTARTQNSKNAALQERNDSYDLTVIRITAKSVPHSRGCAGTTNQCGTGTQPRVLRGLYTPPSYGSQDDVEGLIRRNCDVDYWKLKRGTRWLTAQRRSEVTVPMLRVRALAGRSGSPSLPDMVTTSRHAAPGTLL